MITKTEKSQISTAKSKPTFLMLKSKSLFSVKHESWALPREMKSVALFKKKKWKVIKKNTFKVPGR